LFELFVSFMPLPRPLIGDTGIQQSGRPGLHLSVRKCESVFQFDISSTNAVILMKWKWSQLIITRHW